MAVDSERSAGRLLYEHEAHCLCKVACAAAFARAPDRFAARGRGG
jgi:hypothetical protein